VPGRLAGEPPRRSCVRAYISASPSGRVSQASKLVASGRMSPRRSRLRAGRTGRHAPVRPVFPMSIVDAAHVRRRGAGPAGRHGRPHHGRAVGRRYVPRLAGRGFPDMVSACSGGEAARELRRAGDAATHRGRLDDELRAQLDEHHHRAASTIRLIRNAVSDRPIAAARVSQAGRCIRAPRFLRSIGDGPAAWGYTRAEAQRLGLWPETEAGGPAPMRGW
jgi:hypothetical protein